MVLIALRYPNGRTHEVELDTVLAPGDEFDLYGRRWRVLGQSPRRPRGTRYRRPIPIACVAVTPSPLAIV